MGSSIMIIPFLSIGPFDRGPVLVQVVIEDGLVINVYDRLFVV